MAVFHDVLGALRGYVAAPPLPTALGLAVLSLGILYHLLRRGGGRPDLNHVPVLGAQLGFEGRKAEYARNATEFLQRVYDEVRTRFLQIDKYSTNTQPRPAGD